MPNEALQQTYDSYLEAYNDIAADERERLLRLSVTDDIASTNPNGESHGLESLMEHIVQFQNEKPGPHSRATSFLRTMASFYRNGQCLARTVHRSQLLTAMVGSMSVVS